MTSLLGEDVDMHCLIHRDCGYYTCTYSSSSSAQVVGCKPDVHPGLPPILSINVCFSRRLVRFSFFLSLRHAAAQGENGADLDGLFGADFDLVTFGLG